MFLYVTTVALIYLLLSDMMLIGSFVFQVYLLVPPTVTTIVVSVLGLYTSIIK